MTLHRLLGSLALLATPLVAHASGQPFDSAITWQGQLKISGAPANGTYDLRFTLYNDALLNLVAAPPVTVDNLVISNGLITVPLDFGFAPAQPGNELFLGIEVRDGASTGAYTALAPRQEMTPNYFSQYALSSEQAHAVADNAVTSAGIVDGTITGSDLAVNAVGTIQIAPDAVTSAKILDGSVIVSKLATNAVTSAKILDGTITDADINSTLVQRRVTGSCAAGSSIRAVAVDGSVTCQADTGGDTSTLWSLSGNAGTNGNNGVNFLGTSDNVALTVKVNNSRVAYFSPITGTASNVILGGAANSAGTNAIGATIGGGGTTSSTGANSAWDDFTTIAGGSNNQAGNIDAATSTGNYAFVGGGAGNKATGSFSSIAGGNLNQADGTLAAIAGGAANRATGVKSTVGGGGDNIASGPAAVVGGGDGNTASGLDATVGGGVSNVASANYATAAGGFHNNATDLFASVGGGNGNTASGTNSTVAGGVNNNAIGNWASIPGGQNNTAAGNYSFAAGNGAKASTDGSFVWADNSSSSAFGSSQVNQFLVRADGGVGINMTPPATIEMAIGSNATGGDFPNVFLAQRNGAGALISSGSSSSAAANDASFLVDQYNGSAQRPLLQINGSRDLTVFANAFKPGGGSWSVSSDRRLKKDIEPLDGALDRLLRLRGTTFEYIDPAKALGLPGRQTGFIAQEVEQVFPDWVAVGPHGYLTVAPHGFEALTVEALRELKVADDVRIEALTSDNAELRADNAALAERLARIEQRLGVDDAAAKPRGSRQP